MNFTTTVLCSISKRMISITIFLDLGPDFPSKFLGLGFFNMDELDSEMNRFHSNRLVQSTDGLEEGRLHLKRRKTILRETDTLDILTKYEGLSQTTKIAHLQFHLLENGTLTNASLNPEYFDCLPALTEIEIEAEQNDPPICINFRAFLDESICSVPDL